ncbi:MULE transposase, conserved domain protein, partial [mine drainage metagenome]
VLKTVTRDLVGADRLVPVQEVFRYCSRHPSRVLSPDPLTPWKSNYTFALIAEVGRQRFFVHRQFSEIRDELHKGGLPLLPTRSLQHLADRYALLTTAVHLESLQTLAQFLRDRGGYALLIDGTGKAGRMTLQLSDGWSPLVLLSATFPKESREALVPFLRFLDAALGPPVSATRDLSKGIDEALREVWPDLLILSCHQHFLRAEGTKLFKRYFARFRHVVERSGAKKELRALRQRLRQEGGTCREVRQTLAWAEEILSSSRAGKGQGFPFFLAPAEFYRCAERVWKAVEEVLSRPGRRARGAPYRKLQKALKRLFEPRPGSQRMAEDCRRLEERWVWFERLRRVLRF